MNTPSLSAAPKLKDSLLPLVAGVAILYFGREFFIPLALAILISFLLAPLVVRFERFRVGRVGSVLLATGLGFALMGGIAFMVGEQVVDLVKDLPKYQTNLRKKIDDFKAPKDSALSRASNTLKDLTKEINSAGVGDTPTQGITPPREVATEEPQGPGKNAVKVTQPLPVTVVHASENPVDAIMGLIGPVLAPLGTGFLVLIFAVFILLEREDFRDRVIHLVGRGHLQVTTQALNEAGRRVSRYLLAQLLVNVSYGFPIAVALYFIGIPNAFLWGLLATLFRFLPYVGIWIGAAFPMLLALATSPSWTTPLYVLATYLAIELVVSNVIEPWLYGSSTGLSPMAVILAAAFWTWLWGSTGLFLATPLTVCIAVLGKYIPNLSFLDVLLGDKPPIALEDRFYQRLLAVDADEVGTIAEDYLQKHNLAETFDGLIIPALRLMDFDYQQGTMPDAVRQRILEIVRELIEDLGDETDAGERAAADLEHPDVVCIPANDFGDEVIARMLLRVLDQHGVKAIVLPSQLLASETVERVEKAQPKLLCISLLPPGSIRHAIYSCRRLRDRLPAARLLVGMWGETVVDERRQKRFQAAKADAIVTSVGEMVKEIVSTADLAPRSSAPTETEKAKASLPPPKSAAP